MSEQLVKRGRGRRNTPVAPVIAVDDVEPEVVGAPTPELLEKRAKDAARKREERQRARIIESLSKAETIQEFWAEMMKTADPEKLSEWDERASDVTLHLEVMRGCIEGRITDAADITEIDLDTKAMLSKYGEVAATPILLLEKFWQNPTMLARLTSGDSASAIFAKFGILTGLPDLYVHQWQEFLNARRATTNTPQVFFTLVKCSQCDAPATSIPVDLAKTFDGKYACLNCRERSRKGKEFVQEQRQPENEIFDAFGRVKS